MSMSKSEFLFSVDLAKLPNIIIGAVVGFVAGFLVYRNNKKKFSELEIKLKEADDKAEALYDALSNKK